MVISRKERHPQRVSHAELKLFPEIGKRRGQAGTMQLDPAFPLNPALTRKRENTGPAVVTAIVK
jgi:hypothetical protein